MTYYLVTIPDDSKPPEIRAFDDLQKAMKAFKVAYYLFHFEEERKAMLQTQPSEIELAVYFKENGPTAGMKSFHSPQMAAAMLKYENRRIASELPFLTDNLEQTRQIKEKYASKPVTT